VSDGIPPSEDGSGIRSSLLWCLRFAIHVSQLTRLGYRGIRPPLLGPAQQLALPEKDLALQRGFSLGRVRARAAARGEVFRSGDHRRHHPHAADVEGPSVGDDFSGAGDGSGTGKRSSRRWIGPNTLLALSQVARI
jgi:hypothetical protein